MNNDQYEESDYENEENHNPSKFSKYCNNLYRIEDYNTSEKPHNYVIVLQFLCFFCKKIINQNDKTCRSCGEYICNNCVDNNLNCCSSVDLCLLYSKIKKILEKIEAPCFYCLNNSNQENIRNLISLEEHVEICVYRNIQCSGCFTIMTFNSFQSHIKNCNKVKIKCDYCNYNDTYINVKEHEKNCEEKYKICKYCQDKVKIKKLHTHDMYKCFEKMLLMLKYDLLKNINDEETKNNYDKSFNETLKKIKFRCDSNINSSLMLANSTPNTHLVKYNQLKSLEIENSCNLNFLVEYSTTTKFNFNNDDKVNDNNDQSISNETKFRKLSNENIIENESQSIKNNENNDYKTFNYSEYSPKEDFPHLTEIYTYKDIHLLDLGSLFVSTISNQQFSTLNTNKTPILIPKQSQLSVELKTAQIITQLQYTLISNEKNISSNEVGWYTLIDEEYKLLDKVVINDNQNVTTLQNRYIKSELSNFVLLNESELELTLSHFSLIKKL